jgi:hypothetical protein
VQPIVDLVGGPLGHSAIDNDRHLQRRNVHRIHADAKELLVFLFLSRKRTPRHAAQTERRKRAAQAPNHAKRHRTLLWREHGR